MIPLTHGQREIWSASTGTPEASAAHQLCIAVDLEGDVNIDALQLAVNQVVVRHEALRCTVKADGTEMICHSTIRLDVPVVDFSALSAAESQDRVDAAMREESGRSFDLDSGPLVAFRILKLSGRKYLLVFTAHIMICDRWSQIIILEEVSTIYSAIVEERELIL